jgi:hypothetical protein
MNQATQDRIIARAAVMYRETYGADGPPCPLYMRLPRWAVRIITRIGR